MRKLTVKDIVSQLWIVWTAIPWFYCMWKLLESVTESFIVSFVLTTIYYNILIYLLDRK